MENRVIFRQLFEVESSTYTYLLGCPAEGKAILIDPVLETVDRDLAMLRDLDLELAYTVETHVHADHLTSSLRLRSLTGSKIVVPAGPDIACADRTISEEAPLHMGSVHLDALFTPGHTDHHLSFRVEDGAWQAAFTGDALLIDGCGRTDFQGGDAHALYKGIHDKLFTLSDETLVYPGHDYQGRRVSSIGQEKARNPRLGAGKDEAAFVEIMANLNLPYPKKIDAAVPANLLCGQCPEDVRNTFAQLCEPSPQG